MVKKVIVVVFLIALMTVAIVQAMEKEEIPEMEKYYQKTKGEVVILAVNIDPQYNVKKFVTEMGSTFPVLLDEKDKVNSIYHVLTIPTTFFIDEQGIIRHKYLSAMKFEMMEQYMDDM